MTSGSLLPMICLISSRADLTLKSHCAMSRTPAVEVDTQFNVLFSTFATLYVFSWYPSIASCVVTATGYSDSTVFFEILLGTCCSVTLVFASLTSRSSLFVVIILLLSDLDELGCSALFSSALSPSSQRRHRVNAAACSSNILRRPRWWWSVLVTVLGRVPDVDSQWQTTLTLFNIYICLSFLDPWSRVGQLHQPVHD